MSLLSISQILKLSSSELLERLYGMVNDHDLDTKHVTLTYSSDGPYVNVGMRARSLTDDFQPGRYTSETSVRYLREDLKVLFNGSPTFFYSGDWSVTFGELREHILGTYGVLLENVDLLRPGSTTETLSDNFIFNKAEYVGLQHIIELRVAPNSPRFIPYVQGGDSIRIRVIDPNGADLRFLGPTNLLPPSTSLDA